ncbi:MAG: hypothetical protein PVH48_02515 [Cyclobacteriaceae bacterium]|jgi:hypothetical protein
MGTEDFNKELITYLYDEMSTEERQEFEIAMENNPELKREFEELKEMRQGLAQIQDKEVMEPFFLWGKQGSDSWVNMFKRRNLLMFKPFIAVAASLIIVLLVGYLTNFTITYKDQSLYIGFNDSGTKGSEAIYTQDQVAQLVNEEIAKNNAYIFSKLTETESNIDNRFTALENSQNTQLTPSYAADVVTREELDIFLANVRSNNLKVLQTYLQSSSVQQQDYFQAVLTEFSDFVENQREEDLRLIRRSLINLQEDQQAQKEETEQILASILTTVNNQNN